MIFYSLPLLIVGLQLQPVVSTPVNADSIAGAPQDGAEHNFAPLAFTSYIPRPDLFSIPCFACLMEECPEVHRYPANTTIWTKCELSGTLSPAFGDSWYETVDGCYIMSSDFRYYPHDTKRDTSASPICDEEKAHRMPNITQPHASKRQAAVPTPTPTPTYTSAIIDSKHDKKCLVCADPLCQVDTTYARNSSVELECWTVSTMGSGEVISYPSYDERWVMTKEGCYLALSEVSIPCTETSDLTGCLPYCEPPPHYWATIKNYTLAKECATNCSDATGYVRDIYVADFDCWDYGDTVQGNNTWYKGTEFEYAGSWYLVWWPKASLGQFGSTGEPLERCVLDGNSTQSDRHRSHSLPHNTKQHEDKRQAETTAIGNAAPRTLQVVYAYVNEVDTRCRLCTKRICPYYTVYQPGDNMDFTCFVYGSVVDGSDIWFKSGESIRCYVPKRYVSLNGGASISYCRNDGRRSISSTDSVNDDKRPATIVERVPAAQVSDPSQSPDPPALDSCQREPGLWEQWCYNQALACCVSRSPVELFWDCSNERFMNAWKEACRDLKTRTNCSAARRLGNIMEGCESGDV